MTESLRTRIERFGFNFFPAYRRTGARITYIRADWREVRIRLPLNWRTRNYVGTIFGGSMFAGASIWLFDGRDECLARSPQGQRSVAMTHRERRITPRWARQAPSLRVSAGSPHLLRCVPWP